MRDVYLQRRPADIDIATSASPLRVRHIFVGDHMVDLPRSTVKLTHQGEVSVVFCGCTQNIMGVCSDGGKKQE